ncbi:MAG: hypothetical protein RI894_83, partial [Bacteroidota bacterium]
MATTNIATNTTWTTPQDIINNIVVKPGVTLTVTGTVVNLVNGATITVQPTGQVIANGATFTNPCPTGKWGGFVLESYDATYNGRGNLTLNTVGGVVNTISNATIGILVKGNGRIYASSGGLFLNNEIGIKIDNPYNLHYVSSNMQITNCVFLTDSNFKRQGISGDVNNHTAIAGIMNIGCKPLLLTGNQFINTSPLADNFIAPFGFHRPGDAHQTLYGIYCPDETFIPGVGRVGGIECKLMVAGSASNLHTLFRGLDYGIYIDFLESSNANSNNSGECYIFNCDFGKDETITSSGVVLPEQIDMVSRGIFIRGMTDDGQNVRIMSNRFFIPKKTIIAGDESGEYGVYIASTDNVGFRIQNNAFKGINFNGSSVASSTLNGVGMVVSYTRGSNLVLTNNNQFTNLMGGSYFGGQCRDVTGTSGVQSRCNIYTNVAFDIVLNDFEEPIGGIRNFQGSPAANGNPDKATGNVHSVLAPPIKTPYYTINLPNNFINSETANSITYYHNPPDASYPGPNTRYKPSRVYPSTGPAVVNLIQSPTTYAYSGVNATCPYPLFRFTGDGGGSLSNDMTELWQERVSSMTQAAIHKNTLALLKDGGNTPLLENEVAVTQLQDAYQLYSDVMVKSPYVSEEVLAELAEKQNFPPALLRDILVANTHGTKNVAVWQKLLERSIPLPEYMLQQISDASQTGISAKEYLDGQISVYIERYEQIVNQQLAVLESDTTGNVTETDRLAILSGAVLPNLRFQYIGRLLKNGLFTQAEQVL